MTRMNVLWQILFLALAVSAISTTISLSSLFAPLRRWARRRSKWLGKLLNCAYCSSHWVAFFAVAWYHPRVFDGWWLANWVVVAFAVIAVANVVTGAMRKLNYFEADPWHYVPRATPPTGATPPEGVASPD
jgi:hypothetical protein